MNKHELCFSRCRRHHGILGIDPCTGPCEEFKERFGNAKLPTGGFGMKNPCKHGPWKNQPPCYKPPFDELMALGGRTKRLMDFVRDDMNELALKELEVIRGILDKVEAKIKEYMSKEAEG